MNQHGKLEGHGLNEFLFQKGNYMILGSIKKHQEPEYKRSTQQQYLSWYGAEDDTYHPGYSRFRPQLEGPKDKEERLPSNTEIEKTISQAVDKKLFINTKVKRATGYIDNSFSEIGLVAGFVRLPKKVQIVGGYGNIPRKLAVIQVKWPSLGGSTSHLLYNPEDLEIVNDEDLPGNEQPA